MVKFNTTEADREDIANRVVSKLLQTSNDYINARQAAKLLGISISRIYQIKEELGYIKTGDKRQSPIRFHRHIVLAKLKKV